MAEVEKEIAEKQSCLEKLKNDCDQFRLMETNFGDTKYMLER